MRVRQNGLHLRLFHSREDAIVSYFTESRNITLLLGVGHQAGSEGKIVGAI